MIKKVCDRCKVESSPEATEYRITGWQHISVNVGGHASIGYDLCPRCLKALHLDIKDYADQQKTIADRLIEIIEEVSSGAPCDDTRGPTAGSREGVRG